MMEMSFWIVLKKNKTTILGLILLLAILILAIFGPSLTNTDPLEQNILRRLKAPNKEEILGTDTYGRDILTRILYGLRISLLVAILSVSSAFVIGVGLGLIAGYYGGKIDAVISVFLNVLMAFPGTILGILIVAVLGTGFWKVVIAIAASLVPRFIRLARAPTLALKEQEFVRAARGLGQSDFKILVFHILPNIMGDLVVIAALWLSNAVLAEAGLSFLGLGVQPPTPSLGTMIFEGLDFVSVAPWYPLYPGLAIFIIVIAFNLTGDGLRDLLDPKLRGGY